MNEVLEKISKIGIVPVVVLDDAKDAKPLAEALIKGGLPCAEVTFRTAAAGSQSESWQANFLTCWLEPELCLRQSRLTVR